MTDNARIVRGALERLTACDWVITLPDRMDAVRAIAREAIPALTSLENELTTTKAELERARECWRPINTAPRDGTEILLCKGDRVTSGAWITGTDLGQMDFHSTTGEPVGYPDEEKFEAWMSWDGGFREDDEPTYWMPLPRAALAPEQKG